MRRSFTLIELMVVVAVLGILAAILVPNAIGIIDRARSSRAQADLKVLQTAMLSYRSDIGELPPRGDFYTGRGSYTNNRLGRVNRALMRNDGTNWNGPYLNDEIGLDPWGRSYLYDDNDNYGCWNSDSFTASWGNDRSRNTGWFPCCNEPGCNASGNDIIITVYNDND